MVAIFSGDADRKLFVWDRKTQNLYSKFQAHNAVCSNMEMVWYGCLVRQYTKFMHFHIISDTRRHYSVRRVVCHRSGTRAGTPTMTRSTVVHHAIVQRLMLQVRLGRVTVISWRSQRNREASVDGKQSVTARRHRRDALLQRAVLGFQLVEAAQQRRN